MSMSYDVKLIPTQWNDPVLGVYQRRGGGLHNDQAGDNIGKKEAICERLSC